MSEAAGCRVSRFRLKGGGAHVTVLPTRPPADDTNLVPTLVHVLDQARRGQVKAFALVFVVEQPDGSEKTIEASTAPDGGHQMHLLGAMRRAERSFIDRTWPDDE